jgi:membrane fusion protein (multidrug efflux system)
MRGPPPEVEVTRVIQRDVPIYKTWIGNLDGSVNTQVRARVTGYLVSQNYKEGAQVKEGDLLFQIDPRPLQAALDQARGDLARAEATERLASANLKRANELFAGKVISAQERDTSATNYNTAKADLKAQQAAVETAQLNLEFARIISPVDGIAGIATAQIGDLVGPNSAQTGPLTTVSTIDPIKAYVTITEQDYIEFARRLARGKEQRDHDLELEMILADGSIYPHKGTFYFADRQVDVTTGAMRVAALFKNPDALLRPGLFCRVRARLTVQEGALLVPEHAIAELQGNYQVAVVGQDRKTNLRSVTLGEREPPWQVVQTGLHAGETVVVEGLQKVREGTEVEPKPWPIPPQ